MFINKSIVVTKIRGAASGNMNYALQQAIPMADVVSNSAVIIVARQ